MTSPHNEPSPEVIIATVEGRLEKTRFYLIIVGVWVSLSLVLVAILGGMLIYGLGKFSRQDQVQLFALSFVSLVVSLVVLKRQRDRLFALKTDLRVAQARRRRTTSPGDAGFGYVLARNLYKLEAWEYVEDSRKRASVNRRVHNILQATVIIGSILITSLTSAMASPSPLNWITVLLSIIVSASAGMTSYFKFRERSFNLQQTSNAVEKEFNSVELRIHDYGDLVNDDTAAMRIFAERVEQLKEEQRNRELQLEQSPERTMSAYHSSAAQP